MVDFGGLLTSPEHRVGRPGALSAINQLSALNKHLLRALIKSSLPGVFESPRDPWLGLRGSKTPEIVFTNTHDPNVHFCLMREGP